MVSYPPDAAVPFLQPQLSGAILAEQRTITSIPPDHLYRRCPV